MQFSRTPLLRRDIRPCLSQTCGTCGIDVNDVWIGGRINTHTTSSALCWSTSESFRCFATPMIASTIFHASRKEAAADLRYMSLEISRACCRRVVIYSPTTSIAKRSENKMRTCDAGGKTRTACAPCSRIALRMTSMNWSMAAKSS